MIELPEAITIANQINATLPGKRILEGMRGNSPHKFAFYSRSAEEYAAILPGKMVGETRAHGNLILTALEPGYTLILGEGGERILYHPSPASLPKKHQLLLRFSDNSCLSVSVQGWGAALLLENSEVASHPLAGRAGIDPLDSAFTLEHFERLFAGLPPQDPASIKFFLISKPGVLGLGNGCLQDILWHAGLHPRQRAVSLSEAERKMLYSALRSTLSEMSAQGGRDGDCDLFGRPGGYLRILHSKTAGTPCPCCSTVIEKEAYLGGTVYFCPRCQLY